MQKRRAWSSLDRLRLISRGLEHKRQPLSLTYTLPVSRGFRGPSVPPARLFGNSDRSRSRSARPLACRKSEGELAGTRAIDAERRSCSHFTVYYGHRATLAALSLSLSLALFCIPSLVICSRCRYFYNIFYKSMKAVPSRSSRPLAVGTLVLAAVYFWHAGRKRAIVAQPARLYFNRCTLHRCQTSVSRRCRRMNFLFRARLRARFTRRVRRGCLPFPLHFAHAGGLIARSRPVIRLHRDSFVAVRAALAELIPFVGRVARDLREREGCTRATGITVRENQ